MQLSPSSIVRRQDNGYAADIRGALPDASVARLDITLPPTQSTFVAPIDGYLSFNASHYTTGGSYVYIATPNKLRAANQLPFSTAAEVIDYHIFIPVAKGDTIEIWYHQVINATFYIVPLIGSKK